ncbi:hypothetical protein ZOSMA_132G00510 [Zostera marina]|uniref:Uncharacterized protein n=1 Tax=Zostera marina TaxID=29655 RepID=A0A0K9PYZ8_ZOSMR|nr:hypothetical protein ZOSMA_132G00510 [Zostera marina]
MHLNLLRPMQIKNLKIPDIVKCQQSRYHQEFEVDITTMVGIDSLTSSAPQRRSQPLCSPSSSIKKSYTHDDVGGCSVLLERHRFLLVTFIVLGLLCTIYLYFAVTLGSKNKLQ